MPAPAVAAAAGVAARGAGAGAARGAAAGRGATAAKAGRGTPGPARRPGGPGAAGPVAAPTGTDDRNLRRELRGRDAGYEAAYQAGLAGDPLEAEADEATIAAHQAGTADRRREARGRVVDAGRAVPGLRGPGPVSDGAGFVLGLGLYALVLNWLQGGAPQARGWIAAKFINRPYERTAKRGGTVRK